MGKADVDISNMQQLYADCKKVYGECSRNKNDISQFPISPHREEIVRQKFCLTIFFMLKKLRKNKKKNKKTSIKT